MSDFNETAEVSVNAAAPGSDAQAYIFNADHYDIPVNVAPQGYGAVWTYHRIARIQNAQLLAKESASVTKSVPAGNGENTLQTDSDTPTADVYRKNVRAIRGMQEDPEAWEDVTPEVLKRVKFGWMITAVNGYHYGAARLVWNRSELYYDADQKRTKTVRLEIGTRTEPDFVIEFEMKNPGELDIAYYRVNSVQIRTTRGERVGGTKLVTDLRVSNKLFEALFVSCKGASIVVTKDGEQRVVPFSPELKREFLDAIDFQWQNMVVEALMNAETGSLLD